jgi:hypothetical protein
LRTAAFVAASVVVLVGAGLVQVGEFPLADAMPVAGEPLARVRFRVDPATEVRIDGGPALRVPAGDAVDLEPGNHRVSFRHPELGTSERRIIVVRGEELTLEPIYASRSERP